jgi:hypothetical protein
MKTKLRFLALLACSLTLNTPTVWSATPAQETAQVQLHTSSMAEKKALAEATKMVSAIARAIADKPGFSQLPVIHVDYVKRQGSALKAVQGIDFFQSPAGVFLLHKT